MQGFLSRNQIGPLIADTNVDTTFEGDNTVMMQQVAKMLIAIVRAPRGAAPAVPLGKPLSSSCIGELLKLRCSPRG